jgi:carbamoyltransferase
VEPVHDANKIFQLTGIPAVHQGSPFEQSHFDLAASVQAQFERIYTGLIRHFAKADGSNSVFLAGGCALNALANQKLINGDFKYVSVMPAASDRGLGLASALYGASLVGDHVRPVLDQYIGSKFSNDDVRQTLDASGIRYQEVNDPATLMANDISEGRVIAIMRGRAEYGPRALGNRSILAHPFQGGMKDKLNAKIKFRESFRPFAPMVLPELVDANTRNQADLRHMTTTVEIAQEVQPKISEATHLDGSSRVQVIDATSPKHVQELLALLTSHIGVGACINTSFNLAGEPLVNSPSDAIRTFYSSGLDVLYLEDFLITKN